MNEVDKIKEECDLAIRLVGQSPDSYNKYVLFGDVVSCYTQMRNFFHQDTIFERFRLKASLQQCLAKAYPYKYSIPSYDILCLCNIAISIDIRERLPLILFLCNEILEISDRRELLEDILKYKDSVEKAIRNFKIDNDYCEEAKKYIDGELSLSRFLVSVRDHNSFMSLKEINLIDNNIEILLTSNNVEEIGSCRIFGNNSSIKLIFEDVMQYSNNCIGCYGNEYNDLSLHISFFEMGNAIKFVAKWDYYEINNHKIEIVSKRIVCDNYSRNNQIND